MGTLVPDFTLQFSTRQNLTRPLNQGSQNPRRLRLKRNGAALPRQFTRGGVELEVLKSNLHDRKNDTAIDRIIDSAYM
jgi:hypothetical protein